MSEFILTQLLPLNNGTICPICSNLLEITVAANCECGYTFAEGWQVIFIPNEKYIIRIDLDSDIIGFRLQDEQERINDWLFLSQKDFIDFDFKSPELTENIDALWFYK